MKIMSTLQEYKILSYNYRILRLYGHANGDKSTIPIRSRCTQFDRCRDHE
jgi:hypothetical protein